MKWFNQNLILKFTSHACIWHTYSNTYTQYVLCIVSLDLYTRSIRICIVFEYIQHCDQKSPFLPTPFTYKLHIRTYSKRPVSAGSERALLLKQMNKTYWWWYFWMYVFMDNFINLHKIHPTKPLLLNSIRIHHMKGTTASDSQHKHYIIQIKSTIFNGISSMHVL